MAVSKENKKEILANLGKVIKDAKSVVFVNFHGLTSNEVNSVRKALKEKGVGYMVAKKTLARKAMEENKIPGDMPSLTGELSIAFSEDMVLPASEIYSFQKKMENKISILGGIFEGKFASQSQMLSVAQIPPLKVLHAQFVNIINSPIQGFVMALSEIAKKKEVPAA